MSYADYTPPGPWGDGQYITRNIDGTVFHYSAALNTLSIAVGVAGVTENANLFRIINLSDPVNAQDAVTKNYFDTHAAGTNIPSLVDVPSGQEHLDALSIRSSTE